MTVVMSGAVVLVVLVVVVVAPVTCLESGQRPTLITARAGHLNEGASEVLSGPEEARAIVNVVSESPSGEVSYIIQSENQPPPTYEPMKDLPPPTHAVAKWRPDIFMKLCCSQPENNTDPSPQSSSEGGSLEVKSGYAQVETSTPPASSISSENPQAATREREDIAGKGAEDEEQQDAERQGDDNINDSEDENSSTLEPERGGDASTQRSSNNNNVLRSEVTSNHTPRYEESGASPYQSVANFLKDIASSDGFQSAFLGDLIKNFGNLDQNALKLIYSLLIRPLESSTSANRKQDRVGEAEDARPSIPPHLTPHDLLVLEEDRLPLRDRPENGYQPFKSLFSSVRHPSFSRPSIRPSLPVQPPPPVVSGDSVWHPGRTNRRQPASNRRGDESVDVITAPPYETFEVVLGSSLNHNGNKPVLVGPQTPLARPGGISVSHGPSPVSYGNRPGSQANTAGSHGTQPGSRGGSHGSQGTPPLPTNLRLGLEMPPPDALEALPPGSVLIPPSHILGHPKLAKRIPQYPAQPGLDMPLADFLPNLPFFSRPPRIRPSTKPQMQHFPPQLSGFLSSILPDAPPPRPFRPPPSPAIKPPSTIMQPPKPTNTINRISAPQRFPAQRPPTGPPPVVTKMTPPLVPTLPTPQLPFHAQSPIHDRDQAEKQEHINIDRVQQPTDRRDDYPNEDSKMPDHPSNYYDDQPPHYYDHEYQDYYQDQQMSENLEHFSQDATATFLAGNEESPNGQPPSSAQEPQPKPPPGPPSTTPANVIPPGSSPSSSFNSEGHRPHTPEETVLNYPNPDYANPNYPNGDHHFENYPDSEYPHQDYSDYSDHKYPHNDYPNHAYPSLDDLLGVVKPNRSVVQSMQDDKDEELLDNHRLTTTLPPQHSNSPTVDDEAQNIPERETVDDRTDNHQGQSGQEPEKKPELKDERIQEPGNQQPVLDDGNENDNLHDASVSHLWKNLQLIPLAPELFDTPDLQHDQRDAVNLTKLLDGAVPLSPISSLPISPSINSDFDDSVVDVDNEEADARLMAYLLIGACCGLALLSITGVIVIIRFKKTCGSRQIKTRTRLGEQGSVESISRRADNLALGSESGHKLGSWFTGRNEQLGSGKLRSNMALPDVHDHRRARGPHTGSTRDLLSLSSQSSRSSSPRQPESPPRTEDEEPRASWLHNEYQNGSGEDSPNAHHSSASSPTHRRSYKAESIREADQAQRPVRERRYTGPSRREIEQFRHSSKHHDPRYLTSMESEELESRMAGHREQTDSELDDTTTHYDDEESPEPSRYCSDSRELDDVVGGPTMTSQELGDHLSRDLRQYQSRHDQPESSPQSQTGLRRSHSQVSFSRDTVQNEVFLELDNILRQHAHYPSSDPAPSTLGRASRATDHTGLSLSRANTPDSIDRPHSPPSPPTTPPRFSPPPAPPRPPKPGHLSQPGTPSPTSERARPSSPGAAAPGGSTQRPVYWTSEEERLI